MALTKPKAIEADALFWSSVDLTGNQTADGNLMIIAEEITLM